MLTLEPVMIADLGTGGLVEPGDLVFLHAVEVADDRDRHSPCELGGPRDDVPPERAEVPPGRIGEGVPVVQRDGHPPRERPAIGLFRGDEPPALFLAEGGRLRPPRAVEPAAAAE